MCGAPDQDTLPALEVSAAEAVVHGFVTRDGSALPGAYVRLLGATGDFTAEVQTSATGYFRSYAAAGDWTLRTLYRGGPGHPPSRPSTEVCNDRRLLAQIRPGQSPRPAHLPLPGRRLRRPPGRGSAKKDTSPPARSCAAGSACLETIWFERSALLRSSSCATCRRGVRRSGVQDSCTRRRPGAHPDLGGPCITAASSGSYDSR